MKIRSSRRLETAHKEMCEQAKVSTDVMGRVMQKLHKKLDQ